MWNYIIFLTSGPQVCKDNMAPACLIHQFQSIADGTFKPHLSTTSSTFYNIYGRQPCWQTKYQGQPYT